MVTLVRADDYKKKKKTIKALKKKAAERNPDEFYFKMNSSQMRNGVHREIKNNAMDIETAKMFKTQDQGYLNYKKSIEMRKIEKLRENLHFIDSSEQLSKVRNSHKLFVDDAEAVEKFDRVSHFNTSEELLSRSFNRISKDDIKKLQDSVIQKASVKKINSAISEKYTELSQRLKRLKKIDSAVQAVTLQRNLMGKGTKRKLEIESDQGKVTVYKWKRERLR